MPITYKDLVGLQKPLLNGQQPAYGANNAGPTLGQSVAQGYSPSGGVVRNISKPGPTNMFGGQNVAYMLGTLASAIGGDSPAGRAGGAISGLAGQANTARALKAARAGQPTVSLLGVDPNTLFSMEQLGLSKKRAEDEAKYQQGVLANQLTAELGRTSRHESGLAADQQRAQESNALWLDMFNQEQAAREAAAESLAKYRSNSLALQGGQSRNRPQGYYDRQLSEAAIVSGIPLQGTRMDDLGTEVGYFKGRDEIYDEIVNADPETISKIEAHANALQPGENKDYLLNLVGLNRQNAVVKTEEAAAKQVEENKKRKEQDLQKLYKSVEVRDGVVQVPRSISDYSPWGNFGSYMLGY